MKTTISILLVGLLLGCLIGLNLPRKNQPHISDDGCKINWKRSSAEASLELAALSYGVIHKIQIDDIEWAESSCYGGMLSAFLNLEGNEESLNAEQSKLALKCCDSLLKEWPQFVGDQNEGFAEFHDQVILVREKLKKQATQ